MQIVQPPPPSGPPPGPPPGPPARVTDEQIELFSELVKNGETDDVIREKMITSGLNEDDVNYLLNSNRQFLLNIDVYKKNKIMLKTGISSKDIKLNNISLIINLFKNLFFAQKIMILIHYQAIKIFIKQKSFFSKPTKKNDTVSFHV